MQQQDEVTVASLDFRQKVVDTMAFAAAAQEIARRAMEARLFSWGATTLFEELLTAGHDILGRELTHDEARVLCESIETGFADL